MSSQAILLARQIHIFVTCQASCIIVLGKTLCSITVLPRGREDRGPVAGPGNSVTPCKSGRVQEQEKHAIKVALP